VVRQARWLVEGYPVTVEVTKENSQPAQHGNPRLLSFFSPGYDKGTLLPEKLANCSEPRPAEKIGTRRASVRLF
jgi:hypothetical protein